MLLIGFGGHIGLISLYALPFQVGLRDAVYGRTLFNQGWPLFSSMYPLDADIGISAACLTIKPGESHSDAEFQPVYVDLMAPLWQAKQRSVSTPEAFAAARATSALWVAYFRYRNSHARENVPTSFGGFFAWLEQQPDIAERLQPHIALAERHCNEEDTYTSLRGWACPLTLWEPKAIGACIAKDLGVFALPSTVLEMNSVTKGSL